jgi:predicted DNA-binding transcriptional regulator AlpA
MPQQVIDKNKEYQHLAGLESDIADLIERVKRLEAARPPPQGRYLSQEEAAVLIGVKPPTLASWRCHGRGPRYIKIGRQAFYLESDIETWMDAQAIVPVPKEART